MDKLASRKGRFQAGSNAGRIPHPTRIAAQA
jgi:hypothetical protein